jgi:uncharacterized peroxidase-related enzyme
MRGMFTIHTPDSAPEAAREALAQLEARVGFIPNLAATLAESPIALHGFGGLQATLRRSSLGAVEREVIGVAVSHENACGYSIAAHSTFAAGAGAAPEVVAALRAGEPLPEPRLEALRAFAAELTRTRGHADVGALLAAGYTRVHVLEAIAQAAYTTFANLVANALGTPVDDRFA